MWVNKELFNRLVNDNERLQTETAFERTGASRMSASVNELRAQKVRDDLSIDWMRHRINALEKERAILLNKIAGVIVPVPEIVPTRPGTMSTIPDFASMPSFEDVGDDEARRLGIGLDDEGKLQYKD
jgi:hypothetical protein